MLGLLAVKVALTDSGVEGGPPGEVLDSQEGDRGLHTHTGPQQVLQGLQHQSDRCSQENSQIQQQSNIYIIYIVNTTARRGTRVPMQKLAHSKYSRIYSQILQQSYM